MMKKWKRTLLGALFAGALLVLTIPTVFATIYDDVILNGNGGRFGASLSDPTQMKISVDTELTYGQLPGNPTVARPLPNGENVFLNGYSFGGWYTDPNGGVLVTDSTPGSFAVANSHTLYAHWEPDPGILPSYTVNLDPQGGAVNPAFIRVIPYCQYGSSLPKPSGRGEGYTFDGWYTAPNGGGNKVTVTTYAGAVPPPWLYAYWLEQCKVSFDLNRPAGVTGGTASLPDIHVTPAYPYGETIPAGGLPTPVLPGYSFRGWSLYENGGYPVTDETTVSSTAQDHTLYAQWVRVYAVHFDPDGGFIYDTSGEIDANAYVTLTPGEPFGTLPLPKRPTVPNAPNYVFKGWYTAQQEKGGTRVTSETVFDPASMTEPYMLYAHWQAVSSIDSRIVTFQPNGGTLSADDSAMTVVSGTYYGDNAPDGTLPVPVRSGYTFLGWYTSMDGGTKITEDTLVDLAADQTLYAQWNRSPSTGGITRLELAEMIYNLLPSKFAIFYDGSVPYTDCGSLSGRQISILSALNKTHVMEAVTGTEFMPDATVTRSEGARIVSILLGANPDWLTASAILPYTDIYSCGAAGNIEYCYERGIFLEPVNSAFQPDQLLTRADAETWLTRASVLSPGVDYARSFTLPYAVCGQSYKLLLKDYFPSGVKFKEANTLPYGLKLTSDGVLSGTPTLASTYNFAVFAADASERTTRLNLRLTVSRYYGGNSNHTTNYDTYADYGYEITRRIPDMSTIVSAAIVSKGNYIRFDSVTLDGAMLLRGRDYVVSEDRDHSTRVTLHKLTLQTLGAGQHIVTLRFVDAEGNAKYASQSFMLYGRGSSNYPYYYSDSYYGSMYSTASAYAAESASASESGNSAYYGSRSDASRGTTGTYGSNVNDRPSSGGTVGKNVAVSSVPSRPSSSGTFVNTGSSGRITIASDIRNGSVSLESGGVRAGQMATLSVTPYYGYRASSVTVTSSNGNAVNVDHLSGNQYTFIMPNGDAEVSAKFSREFIDVSPSAWYYDAAVWASDNGIAKGSDPMSFNPGNVCTRAEMLTFLWRAKGSPVSGGAVSFTDVAAGSYYEKAVRWALNSGIVKGGGQKKFNPNSPITRADAVTFLYRAAGTPATTPETTPTSRFTDVNGSAYYAKAVEWAVAKGVASGKGNKTFSPGAVCTRAEVVTFLYRAMK